MPIYQAASFISPVNADSQDTSPHFNFPYTTSRNLWFDESWPITNHGVSFIRRQEAKDESLPRDIFSRA